MRTQRRSADEGTKLCELPQRPLGEDLGSMAERGAWKELLERQAATIVMGDRRS
jgi:hypothetical protein